MEILDGPGTRPEPALDGCPSRLALQLLAGKWSSPLVHALRAGPVRTNELRRRLRGISQKVLSQTLRELEAGGLVVRTARDDSVVPHVEYALTDLGRSLSQALVPVDQWVRSHEALLPSASRRD